jgi:hypothetical protein
MVRKMAAARGLANTVRSVCSRARPITPTGIVATMMSQARRSSGVVSLRVRTIRKNALMIRTQSARKYTSSARAVATCNATRNAR